MKRQILRAVSLSIVVVSITMARSSLPKNEFFKLPIKEITIFKDGHAFVIHEGSLPVDESGNVAMDYLPAPILGAFWPYSADRNVKLVGVVAGQQKVSVERTALDVENLVKANIGADVIIKEKNERPAYPATIVSIPTRSSEELAVTDPNDATPKLPQQGKIVLLKTGDGIKALDLDTIQDVTFKNQPKSNVIGDEFRNRLLLKLHWDGHDPAKTAAVGLAYIQKGVRWIPSYRVTLDDNGNAAIELQAALVNELTDFEDVTANLVIGVPTFSFQDTLDPIALQQTVAQLSPYFQRDARTINATSNGLLSQVASPYRNGYVAGDTAQGSMDLGPNAPEGAKAEDLFVFTVKHISLKKGERMVLPIAQYTLKYQDVYSLDLPFAPPPEVRGSLNSDQQAEISRLLSAPKVMHKIRLTNKSSYPLTTAPATIIRDGRVLAQNTMLYTAIGGTSDLELTQASRYPGNQDGKRVKANA